MSLAFVALFPNDGSANLIDLNYVTIHWLVTGKVEQPASIKSVTYHYLKTDTSQ